MPISGRDFGRIARRGARGLAHAGACAALAAAGLWAALPGARADEAPAPEVRGTMRQIAEPLRVALPLALSAERFADPAHREELARALEELAQSAAVLEQHGRGREASFGFLSRMLAHDAAEVNRRFHEGQLEEARFLLGELASDCIGCHARLPSAGDSDLGASLFRSVDAGALGPFEAIRLQLMTRQFDASLASAERLFASPERSPASLDIEGVLDDFLLVAVRIERDPERAQRALIALGARPDAPIHLRETLAAWSESLREIAAEPAPGPGESPTPRELLEHARSASARAQAVTRYPGDRSGFVWDLHASSLLHRYLEVRTSDRLAEGADAGEPDAERAEAYYLLGLTEMRQGESFWPSEADLYLEQAVRSAPGTEHARRAYAVLEEQYGSTGDPDLPTDLARWLSELRGLAEGAAES